MYKIKENRKKDRVIKEISINDPPTNDVKSKANYSNVHSIAVLSKLMDISAPTCHS